MAAFILTDIQSVPVSISILDKDGNPASVNGAPVWASSDSTILTVVAAADGMSAVVTAAGKLGDAQISVTANADTNPADTVPVDIVGTQDFTVMASAAVSIGITVGTPA